MRDGYTMEKVFKLFDDSIGEVVLEIAPDADGLGCPEILTRDITGKITNRIVIPQRAAGLVAKAIVDCAEEMKP